MESGRPPPIDLRQLHAFRVVAQELHFGRAAQRLGIAQPPLSQQIKRLEQALGYRLLDRDTRHAQLTDAGKAMLTLADTILTRLNAGLERVEEIASGRAGRLAVGFTPTTALRILPAIVGAYRERRPDVDIDLSELLPDAIRDALTSGQLDLALMREPAPLAGVTATTVATEGYVAIVPEAHPAAKADNAFDLKSIAREPFVLFPRDDSSVGLIKILALCAEVGFAPRIVQEVPGWQTAISLVGSGIGVSILPESVVALRLPGVAYVPIESPIRSSICLLHRDDETRTMVHEFIACGDAVMTE